MRDKKVTLADIKGGDQGEREGAEGRKKEERKWEKEGESKSRQKYILNSYRGRSTDS